MRYVLIFLFSVSVLSVNGKSAGDSLWNAWSDLNLNDSLRLAAIHQLTKEIVLYQSPDSAFELASLQLALAQNVKSYKYAGEALNTQGISWAIRGDMSKAMEFFEEALHTFEKGKLEADVASALYNIGNVHAKLGSEEIALEYMQRSLDLGRQTANFRAVIRALHGFGRYHEGRGFYAEAIDDYEQALFVSDSIDDDPGIMGAQISIARVSKLQGNQSRSIELLGKALKRAEALEDRRNISYCLDAIGNLYDRQGEPEKALEYYNRALRMSDENQDKEGRVKTLISLGNAYASMDEFEEAIAYLKESLALAEEINDQMSMGIILNNLGMAQANQGDFKLGLQTCLKGLEVKEKVGFEKGLASSYSHIGTILIGMKKFAEAAIYSSRALDLAQENGSSPEIRDVSFDLYVINKALKRPGEALDMLILHIAMKDSIASEENQRALLRQEYKYTYEKQALTDSLVFAKKEALKDLEIQKRDANLAKQRIGLVASGGGVLLLILLAYSIRHGKKRSDELLQNILPEEVASELKAKGSAQSKRIEQVTVLFTDFKGFTAMSENLSPEELVKDLHECFSLFDSICEKFGIEKIKTIGDAYMAAGGLPTPNTTHARDVVRAALEMAKVVEQAKSKKIEQEQPFFEIRIGVHSGPVVAGIVGVKKFQYDIWGDTVNTAARMESSGEVGKVNISQNTYELLKEYPEFSFESRGKIAAKGKGEIDMYFVGVKSLPAEGR